MHIVIFRKLSALETCVLRLDTETSGWDKSMHKLFKGVQDVTYTIDATRGLVYLSGRASPEIVLRIRKAKKHAKLIHMDYGHVIPPPYNPPNPFETVPITYNNYQNTWPPSPYPPMYQPTAPPSPMTQYMNYHQDPNIQQPHPMAFPYNYYPYYVPEVLHSPPPYIPTRDGVTGEQQCRIL